MKSSPTRETSNRELLIICHPRTLPTISLKSQPRTRRRRMPSIVIASALPVASRLVTAIETSRAPTFVRSSPCKALARCLAGIFCAQRRCGIVAQTSSRTRACRPSLFNANARVTTAWAVKASISSSTLDSAASTPTRFCSNGNSCVTFSLTERTLIDCGLRIADCGSGDRERESERTRERERQGDRETGRQGDKELNLSRSPALSLSRSPALPLSRSPALPLSSAFFNPPSSIRSPQSKIGFATSAACEPCARLRKTSTPSATCSARGGPTGLFSAANPTNQPCVRHLTLEVEVPVLPKT